MFEILYVQLTMHRTSQTWVIMLQVEPADKNNASYDTDQDSEFLLPAFCDLGSSGAVKRCPSQG